jgi:hypothetical protein
MWIAEASTPLFGSRSKLPGVWLKNNRFGIVPDIQKLA